MAILRQRTIQPVASPLSLLSDILERTICDKLFLPQSHRVRVPTDCLVAAPLVGAHVDTWVVGSAHGCFTRHSRSGYLQKHSIQEYDSYFFDTIGSVVLCSRQMVSQCFWYSHDNIDLTPSSDSSSKDIL